MKNFKWNDNAHTFLLEKNCCWHVLQITNTVGIGPNKYYIKFIRNEHRYIKNLYEKLNKFIYFDSIDEAKLNVEKFIEIYEKHLVFL